MANKIKALAMGLVVYLCLISLVSASEDCYFTKDECPICPELTLESAKVPPGSLVEGQTNLECTYEGPQGEVAFSYKCFPEQKDADTYYDYHKNEVTEGPDPFCKGDQCKYQTGRRRKRCVMGLSGSLGCSGGVFKIGNIVGATRIKIVKEEIDKVSEDKLEYGKQVRDSWTEKCGKTLKKVAHKDDVISGTLLSQGKPLKNIEVLLSEDNSIKTTTDENGKFSLELDEKIDPAKIYGLEVRFRYIDNDKEKFWIQIGKAKIGFMLEVQNRKVKSITLIDYGSGEKFPTREELNAPLEQFDVFESTDEYDLKSLAAKYYHISKAHDFFQEIGTYLQKPLKVQITRTAKTGFYVFEEEPAHVVDVGQFDYENEYFPYTDYHEFSHYANHMIMGEVYETIAKTERNHGGYANPRTGDSWVEGFAEFMATVIAYDEDRWWEERPIRRGASYYPMAGALLEHGFEVWEQQGLGEEFAIASVLWDLFDGDEEASHELDKMRDTLYDFHIDVMRSFDFDRDDALDTAEILTDAFMTHYDNVPESYDDGSIDYYLREEEQLRLMGDLAELFEVYDEKSTIDLLEYDKNNDQRLDNEELKEYSKNYKGPESQAHLVRDSILEEFDDDEDGSLNEGEIKRLRKAEFMRRIVFVDEYDADRNKLIEPAEMHKFLKDFIKEEPDVILAIFNHVTTTEVTKLPEKIIFEEVRTRPVHEADDDGIDLTFKELWSIIGKPHKDFTSVYNELIKKHGSKEKEINDIFIKHGFYVDKNRGNGKYDKEEAYIDANNDGEHDKGEAFIDYPLDGFSFDEGEKIGTPSNYERQKRSSTRPFKGNYIKVNKEIPRFKVTVAVYREDNQGRRMPFRVYEIGATNKNGLIYVPVAKDSVIKVEAEDVKTENPLIFQSALFEANYEQAINKGYFIEREFEYTGNLPETPERIFDTYLEDISVDGTVSASDKSSGVCQILPESICKNLYPLAGIFVLIISLLLITIFVRKK